MDVTQYVARIRANAERARAEHLAAAKAREKARRGTKHPQGATKSKPTADQRAARRRAAAKSRRRNR